MRGVVLCVVVGAMQAVAQPVCPPINFQQQAAVQVQDKLLSTVSALRRQTDQSLSQYVFNVNVQAQTSALGQVLPNAQLSFFACSGLTARNPGTGPAPNVSQDPLGTAARSIIVTDLTGNGLGSMVGRSSSLAPGRLAVIATNSDFSIRSAVTYAVDPTTLVVLAGDFNGDGKHDIASVYFGPYNNSAPGGISLQLGNGDGTLQAAVKYPAGLGSIAATAWDFNGDGKDDLAVLNNQDCTVTILFGSASGKLVTGQTFSTGQSSFPTGIAVADVNGDGIPDLVTSGLTGINTLLGNGDGTFRTGPSTAITVASPILATGDFNKDGKVDVAITDILTGLIYIFLGDGKGDFTLASQYLLGIGTSSMYVEDLDRDGNPDIVFAEGHPDMLTMEPHTQTVGVLFGNGDGTFGGAPTYLVPGGPNAIVAADFNGDGKLDLAVPGQILLGQGGGRFQLGATLSSGISPYVQMAAADFNGDGKMDLAINNTVYLGKGDGTFQPPQTITTIGNTTSGLAVADFNNDHKSDLAVANTDQGSITVFPGNGNGTFGAGATFPVGLNPTFLLAGDFNHDGNMDLAVANSGFVFNDSIPGSLSILLGKGDGTFQNAVNYTLSANYWPNSISTGDFSNDGIPDLIVTASIDGFASVLVVFIGKGDGTFKPGVSLNTDFGPETVAVADFNGDGKLDLVVPHCCGDTDISFALGNGDGTFQKEVPFSSNGGVYAPAVADFNGDGKPDIAFVTPTVGPDDSSVFIFLNVPTPQANIFSSANAAAVGVAPGSLASAYGTDLASSVAGAPPPPYPPSFAGTSVSILDSSLTASLAPLLYVSPTQVNFEVPSTVALGAAQATINSGDGTKTTVPLQINAVAPGIFELNSAHLAAADVVVYHTDSTYTLENVFSVNSAGALVANPVSLGSSTDLPYLLLFGTGLQAAGTAGVSVSINGTKLPAQNIAYAGPQGGYVGLDQVDVLLPASLAGKGSVTIQLTANGLAANAVNIIIQ